MRVFTFWIFPLLTDQINAWFIRKTVSILLNISAASNAPVLYFTSFEYKTAFIQIFTNSSIIQTKISPNNIIGTGHSAVLNRLPVHQKLMVTKNINQIVPISIKQGN
uniref:G_PROTEIN_RECEP_F1_2 domain-containing protein n=1 Tax=Meloidogyne hapla TaxID=6305 RepID=A0A1I8BI11_MELHA